MRSIDKYLVSVAAALVATGAAAAGPQPLFADDSTLALRLEGPFDELRDDKEDRPELPAILSYTDDAGASHTLNVLLRPRGNRRLEDCRYPPLRVDFHSADTGGTIFEDQKRLKLVRHCQLSAKYEDYVGLEYQIYKAYNAITDVSFRARWLNVEYVETDGRGDAYTAGAFFIEDEDALADRVGMKLTEKKNLTADDLDPMGTTVVALFQYMIGNADWSATKTDDVEEPCCHNGTALVPKDGDGKALILPYDFDQAGLIHAEYASHNEAIGLRPTQRRYRGQCAFNENLEAAAARIVAAKDGIMAAFRTTHVADEREREDSLEYLEESFERITDARTLDRGIARYCEDN